MAALLEIKNLRKGYPGPEGFREVLDVPSFRLDPGQEMALRGPSGTGKTTFLHLIAGLLRADAGEIWLDGQELGSLKEGQRDRLRAGVLGYVFQAFHLLPGLTALQNVLLGMAFGSRPDPRQARAVLERLGLGERLHHRPKQLSTGQQQRVALARALAHRPRLVLADEPTGNLDAPRAQEAVQLLRELTREVGAALLLVSHDEAILGGFDPVLDLKDLNRAAS